LYFDPSLNCLIIQNFSILSEIDTNNNGQVELEEYLQVMCAIKNGTVSHSRFAHMAEAAGARPYGQKMERSGGGL
jgi:hypothetical protein